jgi:FlaA1/EpsC-like NDP-sugar epimerase
MRAVIDPNDDRLHERLLGRRARNVLTSRDRRAFAGARVLITGGGGSIGSALALEVARCQAARITIVEQSEYSLFEIERALAERYPDVEVEGVLGDVSRRQSIELACRRARPEIVFHAAAYKHVTMCERAVCAAVRTNVFGTLNTARAAADLGARFILVSSDKAAQAASVMGATKRLAELVVLARFTGLFRPIVVRFGNVIGSRGSLLEVIADRIQQGLPLQVTDPAATRYFMTPREAVSLVMKTGLLGEGGTIYWLDMGAPVEVLTIVQRALDIAVERGAPPVPIEFIGLRAGEKRREELTSQGLELRRTAHRRIWAARQPAIDVQVVRRVLTALRADIRRDDAGAALIDLRAAVPEYQPSEATARAAFESGSGTSALLPRRVAAVA